MLIKLGNISFHDDEVRLIVPGAEKTTVFLSTTDGGRTVSLDRAAAEKLDLFLDAQGRFDLDGPAFKREVFAQIAELRRENATLDGFAIIQQLAARLNATHQQISTLARQATEAPAATSAPAPGPQLVPSLPTDHDEDPDPMTFVRRGPKLRNPLIADL